MNTNLALEIDTIEMDEDAKQQLEAFGQEVARLDEESKTIAVKDDATEEVALIFINGCKKTHADIEAYRDAKVRPHNNYVKSVNAVANPFKEVLARLVVATDTLRGDYLVKKQAAIDEENRRRIAQAERERLEKERKEREAREEAERLRKEAERLAKEEADREFQAEMDRLELEQKAKDEAAAAEVARKAGDERAAREAEQRAAQAKAEEEERVRKAEAERQASEAERARLEKMAITQDAKADIAAAMATMIAPAIEVNTSTAARTLANGARVGTREADEPYCTNGLPIYADPIKKKYVDDYYQDDARLPAGLPARYFALDIAKVVRDLRNGHVVPGFALRTKHMTVSSRKRA